MNLPVRCPKCRSIDFHTEHETDDDEESLKLLCQCADCDYSWICNYRFTDWEPADADL